MAIVTIPLLGRASGKVADFEFYKLNDKNVVRSKKLKRYKPVNPVNSENQQLMRCFVQGALPLKDLLTRSFKHRPRFRSSWNHFISLNHRYFHYEWGNKLTCSDVTALQFSNGNLPSIFNITNVVYHDSYIEFDLDYPAPLPLASYNFYAVYYYYDFSDSFILPCIITEPPAGHMVVTHYYPPFNNDDFHCFILAANSDNSDFSSSFLFLSYFH